MRRPGPTSPPVALTVAGSDSGGGAGVQADLKAMAAVGAFPTSAVTSVTAQHTRGVERAFTLPVEEVRAQVDAVVEDFEVRAAKTGMLAEAPVVEAVTEWAADAPCPVVVDPVMVATTGDRLLSPAGERAYADLLGEAALVTPNWPEAEVLTGVEVTDADDARGAAEALRERGADAALVTGGHADGDAVDVLATADGVEAFEHPRVDTRATHGTGCTLSAAVAGHLARGEDLADAVERASDLLARAVRYPLDVGEGAGAVHHLVDLRNRAAREETVEAVRGVRDALAAADASELVPEVGLNVVGATPYAEAVGETAAVEGRITRTVDGVTAERPVRFGASSHAARLLLAAREFDPDLRFAANVRHDERTRAAAAGLDGAVATFDRREEPDDADTMDWGTARAFEASADPPVAVADDGAVGKEPMLRLLAPDAATLESRLLTVLAGCR
jgi:hydroxymethylpyrimidine/phosphomethylpyrimidine kinase